MQTKNKITLTCTSAVLILLLSFAGARLYLNYHVKETIKDLAQKLSLQLGHTVTIDKVTSKWHGLFLKITVNDLAILDMTNKVPLFTVNSIVATVDAIKSITNLSPKFRNLLFRSPRMSIHWDGVKGPRLYGLYGKDQSDFLDPGLIMQLLAMQNSVTVENGDLHIQGVANADLPLMDIKLDFKRKSNLEYAMLVRGEIAAASAPQFNFAMNYHGRLDDFSKAMIDFDFKTSNVQVQDVLSLFPKYSQNILHGVFNSFDVRGAVQNGTLRYAKNDFIVEELNIANDNTITGGNGQLEFKAHSGELKLKMQNFQHANKMLFSKPIMINLLRGDVTSNMQDGKLELTSSDLTVKLLGIEISPAIKVTLHNNVFDSIEADAKLRFAHVEKALQLLPDKKLHPSLVLWLQHSLSNGYLQAGSFSYKLGKIHSEVYFKEVDLKYSPEWPSIDKIDGSLILNDKDLQINVSDCSVLGNRVNLITAKFLPVHDKLFSLIVINGNLDTSLQAGLDFLQQTPLNETVAEQIAVFNPSGAMQLNLDLEVDVSKNADNIKSFGTINVAHVVTQMPDIDLPLTEINGIVKFSNHTLDAEKLDLLLFGLPATAYVSLKEDKTDGLQIGLKAPLEIDSLKTLFPSLNLHEINGRAVLVANLQIPWGNKQKEKILSINTDLHGVAINYPLPFNKGPTEIMPLSLKYIVKDKDARTLYVKLADILEANILLTDQKISGGHVSFGHDKALLATNGDLFVSGKIANLDWDVWQPFLHGTSKSDLPLEVDVLINKLSFQGEKFNSMWIKYDSKIKQVSLESPLIIGTIGLGNEQDTFNVKLDKLDLSTLTFDVKKKNNRFVDLIKQKHKDKQLPLIQFYCEQLRMKKGDYRKVNIQLLPRTYGYEITDFSLSNDNIMLQAQGQWQMDNKENTQLSGNAYTKNFGKVLEDWKFGSSISKGNGEINFSLNWPGNPKDMELLNLEGSSHVELSSGIINGVDAGLGRIIGLLSLEALHRRIKLDFSDLDSKGLAFDKLESDLKWQDGVVSSENIQLSSPSARIELFGRTILKTKQLDFNMFVIPKVSVGLPVAAAIAVGNPAIGAAIWLFDKASGYKIGEIGRYKYKIIGTWTAPKIIEIKDAPKEQEKDTK